MPRPPCLSVAAKQCRISMFINQWISYTSSVATGGGVWCWPVSSRPLLYLVKVYWEAPQYSASAVWPAGEVLVGMRVERGETTLSRPAQLRFEFSSTKQDRQQQVETQHARIRYSGWTALTAWEGPVLWWLAPAAGARGLARPPAHRLLCNFTILPPYLELVPIKDKETEE